MLIHTLPTFQMFFRPPSGSTLSDTLCIFLAYSCNLSSTSVPLYTVFLVECVQFHPKCLAMSMNVRRCSLSSRFFVYRGSGRKTWCKPLLTALELADKETRPRMSRAWVPILGIVFDFVSGTRRPDVSPREHDDDGSDATFWHVHCGESACQNQRRRETLGGVGTQDLCSQQAPDCTSRKTNAF